MANVTYALISAASLTAWLLLPARADDGPQPAPGPKKPPSVVEIEGRRAIVAFPHLRIFPDEKKVEATGRICLDNGLLELLACTKLGKVHESLLVIDCEPEHLHLGLLTLGLEPKPQITFQGQGGALEGDRVIVTVEWTDGAQVKRHRAEELIWDSRRGAAMPSVGWVFTGSRFVKTYATQQDLDRGNVREIFAANTSGSIAATFHDPDAILDNPLAEGGDDTVYYVNHRVSPRRGTSVKVIIEPAPRASANDAAAEPKK